MLTETALFDLFSQQYNWQDRYRQLIILSKQLPDFPDDQKTDQNQIHGCENRVWLAHYQQEDSTFTFQGESEGRIIKGLLAVLIILANGKTASELNLIDFEILLKKLNLTTELSETRLLGLAKLIKRIKAVK